MAELLTERYATRDKLYYNFRYRRGSYKARKAMLYPFLMTAKRDGSMLRLHDDGSHQPTKNQELAMSAKCKGWRQIELELRKLQMPAYKKWLKDNRFTAKDNPFSYWLINIAPKNDTLEYKSRGVKKKAIAKHSNKTNA